MTSAAFLAAIALHAVTYCAPDVNWDVSAHADHIVLAGARTATVCALRPKDGVFVCPHGGDRITVVGDIHQITLTWQGLSLPISMKNVTETKDCS